MSRKIAIFLTLVIVSIAIVFGTWALFIMHLESPDSGYENITVWGIKDFVSRLVLCFSLLLALSLESLFVMISFRISRVNEFEGPYRIFCVPLVNTDLLNPNDNTGSSFFSANDEKLVVCLRDRKFFRNASLFVLLAVILIIINSKSNEDNLFYYFLGILSFLHFLYLQFRPARKVIFDRLDGTVTVPGPVFFPSVTIPVQKLKFSDSNPMAVLHPSTHFPFHIPLDLSIKWLSFYMQYMDKNRPLPKGTLLDPYRDKDFKRRQVEGFRPAMIESECLITDDHTGYLNASETFRKKMMEFKFDIELAYINVYEYLVKIQKKTDYDKIVFTGIWQNYLVFMIKTYDHSVLKIYENSIPSSAILVNKKLQVSEF